MATPGEPGNWRSVRHPPFLERPLTQGEPVENARAAFKTPSFEWSGRTAACRGRQVFLTPRPPPTQQLTYAPLTMELFIDEAGYQALLSQLGQGAGSLEERLALCWHQRQREPVVARQAALALLA